MIAQNTPKTRVFKFTLYPPQKGSHLLFFLLVAFPLPLITWTFSQWMGMEGTHLVTTLLVTFVLLLNAYVFVRGTNLFGMNHVLVIEGDRFTLLEGTQVVQEAWIGNLQLCLPEEVGSKQTVVTDSILIRGPHFVPIRIKEPATHRGWKPLSSSQQQEKVLTTANAAEWQDLRQVLCMIEKFFYEEQLKVM